MIQKIHKLKKNKKGQAGLDIFLSVIVALFMIGLVVMVFILAGTKLESSVADLDVSGVIANDTLTNVTEIPSTPTTIGGFTSITLSSVECNNVSTVIPSTNYTVAAGTIAYSNADDNQSWNSTAWFCSYNYAAKEQDVLAREAINKTYLALGDVPDWFGTFIVLAAMIVLILMVVIIIVSIRGARVGGAGEAGGSGRGKLGA